MILKKHPRYFVAGILFFFLVVSLSVSSRESTTMDEKAHIPSAYTYVKYHDMRLNPEHPPLLKDLAGFPLLLLNPVFPEYDPLWTTGINEQWTLGDKFLHENENNADAITFWSRLPIILIAILLGVFIYIWTKELAGTLAGLFALTLYAFDPNILGHSHYVTTDIGIAAFVFISAYYFVRFLKEPTEKNVWLAGIFLGLAQLTKFSAVLLFPLFGLIAILYALSLARPPHTLGSAWAFKCKKLFEYLWKYSASIGVCFLLIWIVYLFNTWSMPPEKIQDIARTVFGDTGMGKLAKAIVIQMSDIPLLKSLSEYFLGVFMVFTRVTGGNTYFFLGEVSNHATSSYFPLVFLLKETLPFLFLMLAAFLYTLFRSGKQILSRESGFWNMLASAFHSHIAQVTMLGFVVLYSYLSITGNLNIGFRHLFPILPFLYLLVGKILADLIRRHRKVPATRKVLLSLAAVFILWIVAIPVRAYPHYLSYFNEIAGGHRNGYQYVTDSNYDWGQDLKNLKRWVTDYNHCVSERRTDERDCENLIRLTAFPTKTPITNIRIDYFGGSSPAYYFGNAFIPWHGELPPEPGWYAVSAGFFQESIHKQHSPGEWSYTWLREYPMVARAGDSIFIFYVDKAPE